MLKPIRSDRLTQTLAGLKSHCQQRLHLAPKRAALEPVMYQLHMVPMTGVFYLEEADKYVRVFTQECSEVLLRAPLKELLQRLDGHFFKHM